MTKRTKGFTLVELLVVVAIIALLVSILLPTLGKAKEQARMVICLTNLKGLHLGFTYYTAENNDWYPPGTTGDNWDCGSPHWDFTLRDHYGNIEMLHCPSDKLNRVPLWDSLGTLEEKRYPRSYAINYEVSNRGPVTPSLWPQTVHKTTDVEVPAETFLLAEMWEEGYYGGTQYRPNSYDRYEGFGIFYWAIGEWPTDNVHRNNDAANYLFCDGHVILLPENDPNLTNVNDFHYWKRKK